MIVKLDINFQQYYLYVKKRQFELISQQCIGKVNKTIKQTYQKNLQNKHIKIVQKSRKFMSTYLIIVKLITEWERNVM